MSLDDLGPGSALNSVTTRPTQTTSYGTLPTWFKPCSTPSAQDGTQLTADWLNNVLAQLRTAFSDAGILIDNGDDMAWRAMLAAGVRYGVDTGTANAIVVNFSPAVTTIGMPPLIAVKLANSVTGPTTLTANATATTAVTRNDGAYTPFAGGEINANQVGLFLYDGTRYILIGALGATGSSAGSGIGGAFSGLAGQAAGGTQTASWTIKELVAEASLGAAQTYKGASLSLNFNGAGTGAGGMDTGSPPTSGDLSVYAIFNPTTSTWTVLGCLGSASNGPVYTGTHLPSGYTASALIASLKTDSSGNIAAFRQTGHRIDIVEALAATVGVNTTWTSLSLSTIVPANAAHVRGTLEQDSTFNGEMMVAAYGSGSDVGAWSPRGNGIGLSRAGYYGTAYETPFDVAIFSSQTIYYCTNTIAGGAISVTSYDF